MFGIEFSTALPPAVPSGFHTEDKALFTTIVEGDKTTIEHIH